MHEKYNALVKRLVRKMELSKTRVPGFIVGLSGTDSIVAFALLNDACRKLGLDVKRVIGIHYVNKDRRKPSWFESSVIPWLKDRYPSSEILVETPLGGNQDPQRWADIHLRALNSIEYDLNGKLVIQPLESGKNFWIAGTINLTEKQLGKYSVLANSASIQPIQTLRKSIILDICSDFNVPQIAIDASQIPDCLCGREELAAQNIKLIDDMLDYNLDISAYPAELINQISEYIREIKLTNDFKIRIPYLI